MNRVDGKGSGWECATDRPAMQTWLVGFDEPLRVAVMAGNERGSDGLVLRLSREADPGGCRRRAREGGGGVPGGEGPASGGAKVGTGLVGNPFQGCGSGACKPPADRVTEK